MYHAVALHREDHQPPRRRPGVENSLGGDPRSDSNRNGAGANPETGLCFRGMALVVGTWAESGGWVEGLALKDARRPGPGRKVQTAAVSSARRSSSGTQGACGVALPPGRPPCLAAPCPPDPTPEPAPFAGFQPHLTLSKDEVLDVIITLEEVIEILAGASCSTRAEELARIRHHLLSRLER